jgi:hypothetical protein
MGMLVCWAYPISAGVRRRQNQGGSKISINVQMPSYSHDAGQCSGNCSRHFPDRVSAESFAGQCQLVHTD